MKKARTMLVPLVFAGGMTAMMGCATTIQSMAKVADVAMNPERALQEAMQEQERQRAIDKMERRLREARNKHGEDYPLIVETVEQAYVQLEQLERDYYGITSGALGEGASAGKRQAGTEIKRPGEGGFLGAARRVGGTALETYGAAEQERRRQANNTFMNQLTDLLYKTQQRIDYIIDNNIRTGVTRKNVEEEGIIGFIRLFNQDQMEQAQEAIEWYKSVGRKPEMIPRAREEYQPILYKYEEYRKKQEKKLGADDDDRKWSPGLADSRHHGGFSGRPENQQKPRRQFDKSANFQTRLVRHNHRGQSNNFRQS